MIIELEVNGARVIISGDNLTVNVSGEDAPATATGVDINAYRPLTGERDHNHPLKVWRKDRGITQAEMAEKLGISTWMANSVETGRRVPSFALVQKIIAATNGAIQANDLFRSKAGA